MNEQDMTEWVDNATYSQLLERWRHAPAGDEMFVGEFARYYSNVMHEKKLMLDDGMAVQISKEIGW